MEKWIKANEGKLMVIAGLFTLWCFYSVVHQGGSIVPRIAALEKRAEIHRQSAEEFSTVQSISPEILNKIRQLRKDFEKHTHRYNDGSVRIEEKKDLD